MTPVPLTDEEYRLFREWLAQEFGLWFGPERREILRARLEARRVELGLSSFHQLFFHLKFHPQREAERQRLIPHLTNNESYFFRERKQLELFRDQVLPQLSRQLHRDGRRDLRVLSAGCAAGQEAYTLAMILRGSVHVAAQLRPHVLGVDLDPRALEQAREARYTAHSFRGLEPELRERHFREVGDQQWEVEPRIRGMVAFQAANLADAGWAAGVPQQDVIFCRNVLIYFDAPSIRRAAQGLHDALVPGGYLFLGHAETLSRVPTRLVPERRPGAVFYRRPDE